MKFQNIKEEIAIHCSTEELANKVYDILDRNHYFYAYSHENGKNDRWVYRTYDNDSLLYIKSGHTLTQGSKALHNRAGKTTPIIPAEDFIRANTEEPLYQIFN